MNKKSSIVALGLSLVLLSISCLSLSVNAQNQAPHATFWVEIVSAEPHGTATIRLHPEGSYAYGDASIVFYNWTFPYTANLPIITSTPDVIEKSWGRMGNSAAAWGLEGRTVLLTVTDSNGLSSTTSTMVWLPPDNMVPEVPYGTVSGVAVFGLALICMLFVYKKQ